MDSEGYFIAAWLLLVLLVPFNSQESRHRITWVCTPIARVKYFEVLYIVLWALMGQVKYIPILFGNTNFEIWPSITWLVSIPIGSSYWRKTFVLKLVFDLGKLGPLSLNSSPEIKYDTTIRIGRFVAHLLFLPLVAIYHSLGSRAAQLEPCTFDLKVRNICNHDVIWPWKYWPRVTNFNL